MTSTDSNVLVTVVITTKNRPEMVRRAIRSVWNQTHQNMELIVVDDGSDQPLTEEMLADGDRCGTSLRNDQPVRVCAARNQGLAAANGDWIVFLDDDDELTPKMVEQSLEAAIRSSLPGPVSVLSTMQVVDHQGTHQEQRIPPVMPKGSGYFLAKGQKGRCWIAHNSLMAPTAVIREMGGWDPVLGAAEHDDFFLRLNEISSIDAITDVGYVYHLHAGEHLNQNFYKTALDMEHTLKKHWTMFQQNRIRMAKYAGSCGYYFLRADHWWKSIRWCSTAVRINPREKRLWVYFFASLAGPFSRQFVRRARNVFKAARSDNALVRT